MRISWILAATIACFTSSPAAADITARYTSQQGGAGMTVQVNDRGDSRISMGSQSALLTIAGETYLLEADLAGTYVVRLEDAMAALAEQARMIMGDTAFPAPSPSPDEAYHALERGTETVAGRTGALWVLRQHGQRPPKGGHDFDLVISSDPELAPVGRVVARQYGGAIEGLGGLTGQDAAAPGSMFATMRSVLERGTLIRMGRHMRLESAEPGPIPASAFVLPSAPLTRAQYAVRKGWAAPRPD